MLHAGATPCYTQMAKLPLATSPSAASAAAECPPAVEQTCSLQVAGFNPEEVLG